MNPNFSASATDDPLASEGYPKSWAVQETRICDVCGYRDKSAWNIIVLWCDDDIFRCKKCRHDPDYWKNSPVQGRKGKVWLMIL